jgi:hypothetical protein
LGRSGASLFLRRRLIDHLCGHLGRDPEQEIADKRNGERPYPAPGDLDAAKSAAIIEAAAAPSAFPLHGSLSALNR